MGTRTKNLISSPILKIVAVVVLVGCAIALAQYLRGGAEVLWTFRPPKRATAAVAVAGKLVFLPTGHGLYALDKDTGERKWFFRCDPVRSRPVAVGGFVYFATLSGRLYAVEMADGEERWRWDGARGYHFAPSTGIAISQGTVIVPGPGALLGLDAITGKRLWSKSILVQSPLAVAGGVIYFATAPEAGEPREFCALEADSRQEKWKLAPQRAVECSEPVPIGRTIWFWSRNSLTGNGYVYAIDAQWGREKWRIDADRESMFPVAGAGGLVFIARRAFIRAVDTEAARPLWTFSIPGADRCIGPVGVDGDTVYVVTESTLYALDAATGAIRNAYVMRLASPFAPAAADGVVYALDAGGLRAIR